MFDTLIFSCSVVLLINTFWTFSNRKNLDGKQLVLSILFRLPIEVFARLFIVFIGYFVSQYKNKY